MMNLNSEEKNNILDGIMSKEDLFEAYDKNNLFEILFMDMLMITFIFLFIFVKDITIIMLSGIILAAIAGVYAYYKNLKKLNKVRGKIYIESTTYLDDISIAENVEVIKYQPIQNDIIGIKDPQYYTTLVHEPDGGKAYYVSRVPLNEEIFSAIKIPTQWGIIDGLGVSVTSKIIDIIFDPMTGKNIPVKQILMSPSLVHLDNIELEPMAFENVVLKPITNDILTESGVKAKELTSYAITCSNCGGKLDISKVQKSDIGMFIHCEYCGTDNGIRTLKE